jgi:hypothetical protein
MYVCMYVFAIAYYFKTRSPPYSWFEHDVHMISEIHHVHWLSDWMSLAHVNSRQAHVIQAPHHMYKSQVYTGLSYFPFYCSRLQYDRLL